MRYLLLALAVSAALIGIARAQVWIMSPAGHVPPWGAGGGGGVVPTASFLLIQTGSIMLIQTGSKLEIHS
jgi:hypothetical protein